MISYLQGLENYNYAVIGESNYAGKFLYTTSGLIAIKDFLLTGSRKLSAVIGESNYA
jgi:hypothetical protein